MMKRKNSTTKYFLLVLASLALHLAGFYTVALYYDFVFVNELHRLLDHKIVDKTKDLSTQIELVDLEEKRMQIVEQQTKTNDKTEPKDTKFLSASNQNVKKQTKAKNNGAFKNRKSKSQQSQQASKPAMISVAKILKQQFKNSTEPAPNSLEKLGLKGFKPSLNKNIINNRILKTAQSQAAQFNEASLAGGPSQTDDYLEDIEEGEYTLLRTKRFKFFSYYSRLKGQLRSHWNPLIQEEVSFIYSTNRSLANLGKKRTSLKVTLNKRGYLEEIALLKTSGNKAIDAAAIQAFRLAAPFPNPPAEMLEKDKKIRILWDFVLET